MINYIALFSALAVSSVSAYYSIIGLTAIFSGQFWPIVIMGSSLEVGKLITASWLYRNWRTAPVLIKAYLTSAVVLLMFITSMGIFGFLSKAHIEQTLMINSGDKDQISIVENNIKSENVLIEDLNKQIQQIDAAVNKMNDSGKSATSLKAADQQRKTRNGLLSKKEEHVKNISEYMSQKIKLESNVKRLEAEVGPLKYIADLIYEKSDTDQLEKSVRFVIIILVLVFDPLAVVLLIAANHGITTKRAYKKRKTKTKTPSAMKINSNKIFK